MADNAARPPEPPDRTIALALAAGHADLYARSATFRASVDHLARLLPAMVDGLAADARAQDGATERLRESAEGAASRVVPLGERRPR